MPTRLCADPSCGERASYRGRCAAHARANDRSIRRAGRPIYNTARWKRTRRAFLAEHPLCEAAGCTSIATDVHHRVDVDDGGAHWSWSNLAALCHACHSTITRYRQD